MQLDTYTPEQLQLALQKAKIDLMSKPDSVFFADLVLSFKFVWNTSIETAQTNGVIVEISPDFFMSLTRGQRAFVLVHEVMHPVLHFFERVGTRNWKKFNIAQDHVINLMLEKRGFELIPFAYPDHRFKGKTSEQVYDLLPDPPPDYSPDVVPLPDGITPEEMTEKMEDIIVRAATHSKQANDAPGTIPGAIQLFLDKLLTPKMNWKILLARYFTKLNKKELNYKRPHRRYWPTFYVPTKKGKGVIDLAFAVDISGSVTDQEFTRFISEMAGALRTLKPGKITVLQFDTKLQHVAEVTSLNELSHLTFTGRGGTAIAPVLNWVEEHKPKVMIVFTDGEFRFVDRELKTDFLWMIHGNTRDKFKASFGKIIKYEAT
jgi:predicted metal-dependent peptidase